MELNHLVDAVLRIQGNSGVEGEAQEVEVYFQKPAISLTYQQIEKAKMDLEGGTSSNSHYF